MTASKTSHRLSSCQVVLNKRPLSETGFLYYQNLSFWVLSQFESLSFVTIWVVDICHSLSFWKLSNFELSFVPIQVFEFLSCWILSHIEFLKFVKLWVEFCPNLSFWVMLQFKFLSFGTNKNFEFCNNISFWAFSQFLFSEFCHNFS